METKTHKVTMTVELTVEAPENKTTEEVNGFAYWLIQPFIEQSVGSKDNECEIKEFNIEVNE